MATIIKVPGYSNLWSYFTQVSNGQEYSNYMEILKKVRLNHDYSGNYPDVAVIGKDLQVTIRITHPLMFTTAVMDFFSQHGLKPGLKSKELTKRAEDLVERSCTGEEGDESQQLAETLCQLTLIINTLGVALGDTENDPDSQEQGALNLIRGTWSHLFKAIAEAEDFLCIEDYRSEEDDWAIDYSLYYEDLRAWNNFTSDPTKPHVKWVAGEHTTQQIMSKLGEILAGEYQYFHESLVHQTNGKTELNGNLMVGVDSLLELIHFGRGGSSELPNWDLQIKSITNLDFNAGEIQGECYTAITIGSICEGHPDTLERLDHLRKALNEHIKMVKEMEPDSESIFHQVAHVGSSQGNTLTILVKYN